MVTFDRRRLRARRAALPRSVRRDASAAVAGQARRLDALATARTVAAYVPVRGELDPWPILAGVRRRGGRVFVPVVDAAETAAGAAVAAPSLAFVELAENAALAPGRFGIPVPPPSAPRCATDALDVVLVPLLAFDAHGTRVGMGAGYYDRTFASRSTGSPPPLLVGLAYRWQEVGDLDADPWDVRLDAVLTDVGLRRFR